MSDWLEHPLLVQAGVRHGFGLRSSPERAGVRRPVQVHGARVVRADDEATLGEADAALATRPGVAVGVATADCVPVLIAAGSAVAAVHAGWRGLAQGVIPRALEALREAAPGAEPVAAVGPCIGPCCYEVDAPVLDALGARFGAGLDAALRPARPGHVLLDLSWLAREALGRAGVAAARVGTLAGACTRCDAARFHSFRRDGAAAGRLLSWVEAPSR
jgi:purine-nucleoside/S-methyl-5'-thioadenosine phosphorylase / adenosine deaminase